MDRDKLNKSGYEHKRIHPVCLPKFEFTSINPTSPWGAPKGACLFQPLFLLHFLDLFLSHGKIRDFTNFSQLTTKHRISCPLHFRSSMQVLSSSLQSWSIDIQTITYPSLLIGPSKLLSYYLHPIKTSQDKGWYEPTISIYLKNMKSISFFVDFSS